MESADNGGGISTLSCSSISIRDVLGAGWPELAESEAAEEPEVGLSVKSSRVLAMNDDQMNEMDLDLQALLVRSGFFLPFFLSQPSHGELENSASIYYKHVLVREIGSCKVPDWRV